MTTARALVIKVTSGADRPEACAQALNVAGTAVAVGAQVSLWLTGEASWLALPGRAGELDLPHSAPAAELFASVVEGGTVTLCTQCAVRRGIEPEHLIPGVRIAGAATFVEEILAPGVQALVY